MGIGKKLREVDIQLKEIFKSDIDEHFKEKRILTIFADLIRKQESKNE